jgi:hypothetical protein
MPCCFLQLLSKNFFQREASLACCVMEGKPWTKTKSYRGGGGTPPRLHVGWGQFSDVAIQKSKSLFENRNKKKIAQANKSDTIYRVLLYKIFADLGGGNSGSTQLN